MKKYIPILVLVIILLTVILAVWFDDFVDQVFLQPLAYLIFVGQVVFRSFHQGVVWISFIVIAVLIDVLVLVPEMSPPSKPKDKEWDYPDRVHIWERHISAMNEGSYLRISLEDHLADLIIDALSYHNGERAEVLIQQFRAGEIVLPSEVHFLVLAGYQPSLLDEKIKYQYHPEEIIQFLESQIDV